MHYVIGFAALIRRLSSHSGFWAWDPDSALWGGRPEVLRPKHGRWAKAAASKRQRSFSPPNDLTSARRRIAKLERKINSSSTSLAAERRAWRKASIAASKR
jgi:hypothetical protein